MRDLQRGYTIGGTTYVGAHADVVAAIRSRNAISHVAVRLSIQHIADAMTGHVAALQQFVATVRNFARALRSIQTENEKG